MNDDTISRSTFLRVGGTAAAAAGVGLGAWRSGPLAAAAPQQAGPTVQRMGPVTGPDHTDVFAMAATDLGIPVIAPDGRMLTIFGDTFEPPKAKSDNWRAPVALYADPERKLADGIAWTGAVGGDAAAQLVDYVHEPEPGVTTILPGDVVVLGDGTLFLWVMVNHGFGNVSGTEIWTSKDSGETWDRTSQMFPGDHLGGLSQQCTWAWNPEDDHVYLLTTGFQRDKPIILQRVAGTKILDPAAYETWGYADGEWAWGNAPTPVLDGAAGEMCWRIIEGKWVLSWFNAGADSVDVLIADGPTADLHEARHEALIHGTGWGQEDDTHMAQLYGGYIVPGSTLDDLHLLVSQWNTDTNWPYLTEQFRITGLG